MRAHLTGATAISLSQKLFLNREMALALWKIYTKILDKKGAWFVLLATVILSVFFALHAIQTKTINTFENLLPENDKDLLNFKKFIKEYGGDLTTIIVFENKKKNTSILTKQNLAFLEKLTEYAEGREGVLNVSSLTNSKDFYIQDQQIEIRKLYNLDEIDKPRAIQNLKEDIRSNPIIQQYLVSKDFEVLALYVQLDANLSLSEQQQLRDTSFIEIRQFVSQEIANANLDLIPRYAGRVGLEFELDKSTKDNQVITSILIMGIIALALLIIFRSFRGLILTMAAIGLTHLWTMGFVHVTGKPLNFITAFLPPLVLIVAVLDCIHIFAIFRSLQNITNLKERLEKNLHLVVKPCLLTSITTAIGFGSLVLSDIQAVRHFGFFATFGIFIAFYFGVVFLPAALTLFWNEKSNQKKTHPFVLKITDKIARFQQNRNPVRTLLFFGAITLFFVYGFQRVYIETKPVTYYNKDHHLPQNFLYIDKVFGGSNQMDFVIRGPNGAFLEPENLKFVEKLKQVSRDNVEKISQPLSILDYLKRLRMKLNNNDPAFFALPTDKKELRELFFILENEESTDQLIDTFEYNKLRISLRAEAIGSSAAKKIFEKFYQILDEHSKPPLTVEVVGSNVVWINLEDYVVSSLIKSFSLTILLVTILLCILLRSIKWGILSMVPNLFPIIATFGLMGWLGIPLNMFTLMIASIGIGIAVDDTIHLMVHIRRKYHEGLAMDEAIKHSINQVGLALITTSFLLACGFWSITIVDFLPIRHFGFLTGVTITIALIGDLLLLPAIVRLFKKYL